MKTTLITVILLLSFAHLQAQWEKVYEVDNNNFYHLYATDSQQLFIGAENATIYHSSNGGDFSSQQLQPFGFIHSVDFEDDMTGYAGGGCYFTFDDCPANTIYKTEDGGTTWVQILGNTTETGVFVSICAPGNGKVFALSDYGGMIRSDDGGDHWMPAEVDAQLENYLPGKLQFTSEQTGYIQVNKYVSATNKFQRLYKTTDGGESWNIIFEHNDGWDKILDFHFSDDQHGQILSPHGKVQRTSDGGATWTEVAYGSDLEEGKNIFSPAPLVSFLSSYDNTAKTGRIYRSTDGGTSWEVDLELDSTFVGPLFFTDEGNGWALAEWRQIYRRTGANIIGNPAEEAGISVSPNPASDFFMVKKEASSNGVTLQICNAIGQVLTQQALTAGDNHFDAQQYAAGVYFLKVLDKTGRKVWSEKIIID